VRSAQQTGNIHGHVCAAGRHGTAMISGAKSCCACVGLLEVGERDEERGFEGVVGLNQSFISRV
jgi:hypothetical protein